MSIVNGFIKGPINGGVSMMLRIMGRGCRTMWEIMTDFAERGRGSVARPKTLIESKTYPV